MERFNTLDDLLQMSWNLLFQAAVQSRDPFRTPILSTINNGLPNARILVLRQVQISERQLLFYTDKRSPKVLELQANPNVCLVFWNPDKRIQIRAYGAMQLVQNTTFTKETWQNMPARSRKDYATMQPPSSSLEHLNAPLPSLSDEAISADSFENFAVLAAHINHLDCLHLHREGHQRAAFHWKNSTWDKTWLVP